MTSPARAAETLVDGGPTDSVSALDHDALIELYSSIEARLGPPPIGPALREGRFRDVDVLPCSPSRGPFESLPGNPAQGVRGGAAR
jgi:hypothetical protein